MWTEAYLRLHYDPDTFNCVDLYRLILREQVGIDLPAHMVTADRLSWVRGIEEERQSPFWIPIGPGVEKPFDLILMRDLVGRGDFARLLALHCGCVTEPGRMIDIRAAGVAITQFRDSRRRRANSAIKHSVLGIYRPAALT